MALNAPRAHVLLTAALSLLGLLIRARATSIRRRIAGIARAEPFSLALIAAGLLWGGFLVARPDAQRGAALPLVAVGLAQLLSIGRGDARLLRVLGAAPWAVRLTEALLWTSPLLFAVTATSFRNGFLSSIAVAATAVLAIGAQRTAPGRTVRWTFPWIPAVLPEWTVGLRRSIVPLAGFAVLGIAGSGAPGLVVVASVAVTFVTCGFFWGPAEGWLLLHAHGQPAGPLLGRKILMSAGLLAVLLAPMILLGAVRQPELVLLYCIVLAVCLHAHVAAIAVKYAGYSEGQPLHAAGSVVWLVTTAGILIPPLGVLLWIWLCRRAVAQITPFCVNVSHG